MQPSGSNTTDDGRHPDPEQRLEQLTAATPSRDVVERLLADIAGRIGIAARAFDQQGVLSLTVADDIMLTLVHRDGLAGVIAAAELPKALSEELASDAYLLAELLAANLDWQRVGGATFGKLPGTGSVLLCRLLPIVTDEANREAASTQLQQDLIEFASSAADWIDELALSLDLGVASAETSSFGGTAAGGDSRPPQHRFA